GERLQPRAGLGDELPGEEEPVVPVAEARERAPVEAAEGGGHRRAPSGTSRRSGSTAASPAASSSGLRPRRRWASQAVRRERTRLRTRWPSSVSETPTCRRSSALGVRATRPSRSRRSTCFVMAGGETRSRSASSRRPMPGAYLIATRSDTCSGETPTARASRRSSRPTWRRAGLRASASATGSCVLVVGISLTGLTIAEVAVSPDLRVDDGAEGDRVLAQLVLPQVGLRLEARQDADAATRGVAGRVDPRVEDGVPLDHAHRAVVAVDPASERVAY